MADWSRLRERLVSAWLRPQIPVESAVLDGFADVLGEDRFGASEIGDGAGDFEDAVVGAGAEVQFRHGHFHHPFRGFFELAMALDELRGHAGVATRLPVFGEACALHFAGFFHALADRGGSFAGDVARHLAILHGGDFDVDVDAVEEWAGDGIPQKRFARSIRIIVPEPGSFRLKFRA